MKTIYTERKIDKQVQVLSLPSSAIADATSAQLVGKGTLLRVKGTSGGFLSFGPSAVVVPSSSTTNTIETPADFFLIEATDDYVRTSAIMRIEIINE